MLNRLNGKLIKIMGIIIGLFILLMIILMIFGGNKVLSFSKIEDRMVSAAKKYFKDNEELLPKENGDKTSVSGLDLETGYMPNISKLVADGVVCNGEVRVYKFNGEINYVPYLNCGDDYTTKELYKEITKSENIVTTSSGLYKMGDEFVFRGLDVNNYVMFSDRLWRVIKVDNVGNVRLIENDTKLKSVWDDSYNVDKESNVGINIFYSEKTEPSKIYKQLQELVDDEEFLTASAASKLAYIDVCYGSRTEDSASKDGSAECSVKVSSPISLISAYEYIRVSLDENCNGTTSAACTNYNYLTDFSGSYWTSTALSGSTYRVYRISGSVGYTNASSSNRIRAVVNLNNSAIFESGDGSLNNPYKIK